MKRVTRDVFVAYDDREFLTEELCRQYERSKTSIVGRVAMQPPAAITDALAGQNDDLADAIEQLGQRLAKERRARGSFKRARRARRDVPAEPVPAVAPGRPF